MDSKNTPRKVQKKIATFQHDVRVEINVGIKAAIEKNGGTINLKENSRWGFPSVYNEDATVSIMGLRKVYLNARGNVSVEADHNSGSIRKFPIYVLLGLWETILSQGK